MDLIIPWEAVEHTKRQVDSLRKKGILVASYYVEDGGSWYRETTGSIQKNVRKRFAIY